MTQTDVERAARWVVANIHAARGRPRAQLLDHHVAGMMALIQQLTGHAVLESRHDRTGLYQPKLLGAGCILMHFREVDPSITETQLVTKVHAVRRKFAGLPMHFRDFYPLYGATLGDEGQPVLVPPFRLKQFYPSIPIYCP